MHPEWKKSKEKKKRNGMLFRFLLGFMAISTVFLIAMQVYWISLLMNTEKSYFRISVSNAVKKTIHSLEWIELSSRLNGHYEIFGDENSFNISSLEIKRSLLQKKENGYDVQKKDSLIAELSPENKQVIKRSQLMEDFWGDALGYTFYFPLEERINSSVLDSLLKKELIRNGIVETPVYGIVRDTTQDFVYITDSSYIQELLTSDLRYRLYPNDELSPEKGTLILFFSGKESWMSEGHLSFLAISIIFIGIIFTGFIISSRIVMKQRQISNIKNDFINNMTHEIKTPIATISLACEALMDPNFQGDEAFSEQYLKIIREENQRLQNMVEQLLQHAKLEQGNFGIKTEEVDIHKIITQSVNNIGLSVMRKSGQIVQHLNAADSIVYGDNMHLINLIYNLLDNANKYIDKKPLIEVSTQNILDGIEIRVKDNGIGIAKSEQEKIFEKFYRVSTGNIHNVKGYGIGLSYVKQIVELHGGHIKLESEVQKGSEFIVYLPKNHA